MSTMKSSSLFPFSDWHRLVASFGILSCFAWSYFLPRASAELVLVEDGVAQVPVVVFEGAPPKTARAARELVAYIEKISGARLELLEGAPDPLPTSAVWVGYQPVLEELFPEVNFDFDQPEEILIAANENHLVLAGRDRWHPDFLVREGRNWTIEGVQQEYGTVNAVYTFLQDFLEVRWLMPGELGIDVIAQKTLAFEPFEYRYHPQFRLRSNLFRLSDLGDSRGISHEWARFQRLQLDSLTAGTGGHHYDRWWNQYHESNPEYFALQPDGTRSGFPGPSIVKRCKSNPEIWDLWLDDVAASLEEDPTLHQVFASGINDSYNRGHCVCANCLAWDHPDGTRHTYTWEGLSQDYVSLSDRHVEFYNRLARGLRERFPDRDDIYVSGGGYGHWREAPIGVVPEENVVAVSVANFFLGSGTSREEHIRQFRDWGKVAAAVFWRPNTGSPVGWQQGFPDVPFHQTMEDFRLVAENNGIGLAFDTIWEHWSTQGPLYYLMAQLAWNPWQDGEAVLEDYYRRAYGPAYEPMKAYWTLLEETRNAHAGKGMGWQAALETFDAECFAQAEVLLDEARGLVMDAPEVYLGRIEFAEAGLEHSRLLMESARLAQQIAEAGGEDKAASEKLAANRERMAEIEQAQPVALKYNTIRSRAGAAYPSSR